MTTPQHPLTNSDGKPMGEEEFDRLYRMLAGINNPLYKFIIELIVSGLEVWQNMTEEQKARYA